MMHGIGEEDFGLDLVGFELFDPDETEGPSYPYIFTRWARSQLLSHLGTREKWFASVTLRQQADELNQRRHTFAKHKFRLMTAGDGARIVRGLVSSVYAEIADTEVMEAIIELLPNGEVLSHYSGKTDRAFYAYVVSPQKLTIPNTNFEAYPGVVLKNSEVGYTSLWVIPTLWFPRYGSVAIFTSMPAYKRIHRGKVEDLKEDFSAALVKAATVWGDLDSKLSALSKLTYVDEDEATKEMKRMLLLAGSSKLFAFRCEQAYQVARNTVHNGHAVFDAVMTTAQKQSGEDDLHDHSAVAGALLLKLMR